MHDTTAALHSLGMDPASLDLAESRRILETEDTEEAALTQEEEAEKDNIVKLASYNFSRSPAEPQRSPNKKKLSRGMSFQPSVMEEDDDAAFGIRVYGDDGEEESEDDEEDDEYEPMKKASQMYGSSKFSEDDGDEERDSDNEDDDDDVLQVEGVYDPREFEHLNVDAEVLSIFSHIQKYKPQTIILDYKLKPFIPDYIPAVGDIDAFLKVAPPSEQGAGAGLRVLDEPAAAQSDPLVLDLQLRAVTKTRSAGVIYPPSIMYFLLFCLHSWKKVSL